jgi:hypothetical protein
MLLTTSPSNISSHRGWLNAGLILLIALGFIYAAFHHHHDFSSHPDCPICSLAGQAPDIPFLGRTALPFFQAASNQPEDPAFPNATLPRAPPA